MKKHSLLLVFFFITFYFTYAQEFSIGVKGGVNFSNIGVLHHIGGSVGIGDENIDYTADKDLGIQFGIYGMVNYSRFFIRPEIYYSSLKNSYPLSIKASNWSSTQINASLLFGYRVLYPIALYAGPSFSSINSMELEGVESPISYRATNMNFQAGIMAEFGIVGIDFRYEYGPSKVEEQRINMFKVDYGTNLADLQEYNQSVFLISVHVNVVNFGGGGGGKKAKKSSSDWRNHRNL